MKLVCFRYVVEKGKGSDIRVGIAESDQPIAFNQLSDASFNAVKAHFGSSWLPLDQYLELELARGKSGFHIAFLDTGACLTLQSLQIKYLFCPNLRANLTYFDRTTVL